MFGRKKQSDGTPVDDRKTPKQKALAFLDRQKADMNSRDALDDRGCPTTTAVVTMVELRDELHDPLDTDPSVRVTPQEWAVDAEVKAIDGQSFAASFPIFFEAIGPPPGDPPAVGEEIDVLYDPADRSVVRATITWRRKYRKESAPRLRWSVPTACPNCGAPVDQSTESLAEHPECRMCHQPLPCTPV